jgi:hypothetical protein
MMGFPSSRDERNVMARSNARTVEEHLSELPAEKRKVFSAVRDVILKNLP